MEGDLRLTSMNRYSTWCRVLVSLACPIRALLMSPVTSLLIGYGWMAWPNQWHPNAHAPTLDGRSKQGPSPLHEIPWVRLVAKTCSARALLIRASPLLARARVQHHPKGHTYGSENPCPSQGRIDHVGHTRTYSLLTQGLLQKLLYSKLYLHRRFDIMWETELIFDSA